MTTSQRIRPAIPSGSGSNLKRRRPCLGIVRRVRDTRLAAGEMARVDLTVEVQPDHDEPFLVTRRLTVPRGSVPRPSDLLEVAYDADAPHEFAYRSVWATPASTS